MRASELWERLRSHAPKENTESILDPDNGHTLILQRVPPILNNHQSSRTFGGGGKPRKRSPLFWRENRKEEVAYDSVRLAIRLKTRTWIIDPSIDQLAQILPPTTIAFYLVMAPPLDTHQDEAELASVPSDEEQALESMYVDAFRGTFTTPTRIGR